MPGQKKTTPKKSAAKAPKYDYKELGECPLTKSDPMHFYGVIIDATFPYKFSSERFICTLKVIDPSINPKKSGEQ